MLLEIGETAHIKGFEDDSLAGRFLELGIQPGCEIELVRTTPLRKAFYVRVDRNVFALRKEELESIILQA